MKSCILFIDSDHAKIFNLGTDKMDTKALKKHGASHHSASDSKNEEHEKEFFKEVTASLTGVTELLIVGPGLAKKRYETHLKSHHHQDVLKSVIGLETVDHPTDAEIVRVGKKFFKHYDLFH